MNKNPTTYNSNTFNLDCDCGCSLLKVNYDTDGELISLSHYSMSYMAMQNNFKYRLLNTLKILWNILRGKEYCFYEIVLGSKKEVEDFKEFVSKIDISKMMFDE